MPRLLALLARHEVRSTFFVPGYTAVRYPDVVRAIVDGGHEVAHHGYLHEVLTGMTLRRRGGPGPRHRGTGCDHR